WEGTLEEFWSDMHEKAAEPDPENRYHPDLITLVVDNAQLVLQWAILTRYHFPLIVRLKNGRHPIPAHAWRLDETSGTTAADAIGSLHGTHGAGVTVNQTGRIGQ